MVYIGLWVKCMEKILLKVQFYHQKPSIIGKNNHGVCLWIVSLQKKGKCQIKEMELQLSSGWNMHLWKFIFIYVPKSKRAKNYIKIVPEAVDEYLFIQSKSQNELQVQ